MNYSFDEKHIEIARILIEEIKNGSTITYKELAKIVGMSTEKNSEFYNYLGDLSYFSFENGMPLISVIVVRKGCNMPGDGFYVLYSNTRGIKVGKNKEKQMETYVEELNRVLSYDNWNRLIELLESEVFPQPIRLVRNIKRRQKSLERLNINRLKDTEVEFIEVDEFENIDDKIIEEGQYIKRIIESKRRNPKAREMKIEQFKKDNNGRVFCEVCHEDDAVVLDVHHDKVYVSEMEDGHKTKLSDLRIVCSNCHRKVHGYKITVEELKNKK